jgi:hypothetical protein
MGLEWVNLIWVVLGGVISFIFFIIRNSYQAGKISEELITKKEVEKKLDLFRSEFDKKFEEIDNKIEKKFDDINSKLNSMNDILIKQETREIEKNKYEKEIKDNSKTSLERICLMLVEFNKKQDDLFKQVAQHEGALNNRRLTDSFTS